MAFDDEKIFAPESTHLAAAISLRANPLNLAWVETITDLLG